MINRLFGVFPVKKSVLLATVFALQLPMLACAQQPVASGLSSDVPLSVWGIELKRVNNQLIRVLRHNMEIEPKIVIERIATPDLTLLEKLEVTGFEYGDEKYTFADSQGAFLESLDIDGQAVHFAIEFYFNQGGSALLNCSVRIEADKLVQQECFSQ